MNYLMERLDFRDAQVERLPFQEDWEARLRKLPDTEGEIVFAGDSIDRRRAVGRVVLSDQEPRDRRRDVRGAARPARRDHLEPPQEDLHPDRDELPGRRPADRPGRPESSQDPGTGPARRARRPGSTSSASSRSTRLTGGPVHDNASIRELNRQLKDLVGGFEGVTFLDVFDKLVDGDGNLRREWTSDGLHLNGRIPGPGPPARALRHRASTAREVERGSMGGRLPPLPLT